MRLISTISMTESAMAQLAFRQMCFTQYSTFGKNSADIGIRFVEPFKRSHNSNFHGSGGRYYVADLKDFHSWWISCEDQN